MARKDVDSIFNNIEKNLQSLKNVVNAELNQMESQSSLKPIVQLKEIYIKNCSVKECDSGYHFYSKKVIRLYTPKECVTLLNRNKGLGLPLGDISYGFYSFDYNDEKGRENFKKILDAIESIDSETVKQNAVAAEQNKTTRDTVLRMLSDIGIPKQHYGYTSTRARNKSWINYSWHTEIFNAFPVRVDEISDYRKRLEESFNKLYDADQKKRKDEEQKQKDEVARKESERELAFMLAKYELSITSDWDDLLRAIINKNKYLYLAHYLRKNRGDWNYGYSYAECGLENFTVETEQDQQIYDCINNIITTYEDVDGRYFRDCEWSYDVLYGIAKEENPSLYEDYEKACGKTDDY